MTEESNNDTKETSSEEMKSISESLGLIWERQIALVQF